MINLENEVWKDIPEYEGLYQISDLGNVNSLNFNKNKILKSFKDRCGYIRVSISINNNPKKFLVHRLVAEAFIPNPENKPQVNHINGIRCFRN